MLKAREKSCEQGAIGFGFASHWMKNWRETFNPVTERSNRDHFRQSFENRFISFTLMYSLLWLRFKQRAYKLIRGGHPGRSTIILVLKYQGCSVAYSFFSFSSRKSSRGWTYYKANWNICNSKPLMANSSGPSVVSRPFKNRGKGSEVHISTHGRADINWV